MLNVPRSSVYYKKKRDISEDLALMKLIDKQYLKEPTWGSRSMRNYLRRLGYKINRKRVQRLMRKMGLEAIYPKPKTTKFNPEHKVYPYLLRGMTIDQPNQVWVSDITYIPMDRGFMYLSVVMDWHSRKVLSWRLSNTLESDFCVEALKEAIHNYGCPKIFNTDQGSQYTSEAFTGVLKDHFIKISMDGRGRCFDNIIVERLWWTVKYHYVYLHEFANGTDLRKGLRGWFKRYNTERFHQSLDAYTPDEIYHDPGLLKNAA